VRVRSHGITGLIEGGSHRSARRSTPIMADPPTTRLTDHGALFCWRLVHERPALRARLGLRLVGVEWVRECRVQECGRREAPGCRADRALELRPN
jgi:hypothetical protein